MTDTQKIALAVEVMRMVRRGVRESGISYDKNLPAEQYGKTWCYEANFNLEALDDCLTALTRTEEGEGR